MSMRRSLVRRVPVAMTLAAVAFVFGCSDGESPPSDGQAVSDAAADGGRAEAATPREAAEAELDPTDASWSAMERSVPDGGGREVVLARNASSGRNSMGLAPTLFLSCRDGRTKLSIAWYEDPEGNHNDVTTRIDDGREVRRTWRNEAGEASVFPQDSTAVFVRDLIAADSLTVRTNLYKRMPITAVFRLDGLRDAIRPLRKSCGW